jgi:FAD/FMN-containing dehydrogenase
MPLGTSRLQAAKARQRDQWRLRRAEIEAHTGVALETLAALQQQLSGTLIVAGDPGYEAARQLAGPTFQHFPIAIARCESAGDVRAALAAARRAGWPLTCRSGGHSTAGFSSNDGFVIDLSGLSSVRVDPATRQVTVGAGTTFAVLMAALDSYGLHLVGGGCGDVCVGGYLQGGGYGFSSLRFGLHCDVARELTVMLADGSEVVASADENADLFWAMRGGTGNNFGVLLDAGYVAAPLAAVTGFAVSWPADAAADALVRLQEEWTGPATPAPLLGYMGMLANQHGQTVLTIGGMTDGGEAATRALLAPLLAVPGARLVSVTEGRYVALDSSLLTSMCPQPLPASGFSEEKQTGYVARVLAAHEWQALIDHFETTPYPGNVMMIEPYGGAIAAIRPDACAFVHRAVSMDVVFEAIWYDEADRPPAMAWLDVVRDRFAHLFNGHVYQNYPRRGLDDYRWRYWGNNFDTLLWVKRKYDPDNVFRFEQSVSPWPEPRARGGEAAPVLFSDPSIAYRFRPPSV